MLFRWAALAYDLTDLERILHMENEEANSRRTAMNIHPVIFLIAAGLMNAAGTAVIKYASIHRKLDNSSMGGLLPTVCGSLGFVWCFLPVFRYRTWAHKAFRRSTGILSNHVFGVHCGLSATTKRVDFASSMPWNGGYHCWHYYGAELILPTPRVREQRVLTLNRCAPKNSVHLTAFGVGTRRHFARIETRNTMLLAIVGGK